MADHFEDRKHGWQPPQRPDWVDTINREGEYFDLRGVVPLDEASLLATAERNTGLTDYGTDGWQEAFRIIVRGLDQDAQLNLMGRLMCRSDLLMFLEGRLLIEDAYKQHPEIEDEVITEPMFIVGQGRSGTSALLNILGSIPGNGAVKTWEAMFPCPPPERETYLTDPRIEKADRLIQQWTRVTPSLASMHEFTGDVPAECVQFMTFSFTTIWFGLLGQIPEYTKYLSHADWHQAYLYHRRVLKLLQWKNPRRHWVLKATEHLPLMPEILKVYPDACFIWPHRDPVVAVASSTSLTGALYWVRTDQPYHYSGEDGALPPLEKYHSADMAVKSLESPIAMLESGAVPLERLCNVLYPDFVQDPVKTVETIYRYFNFDYSEETARLLRKYVDENPRSARPPHVYEKGSPERIADERKTFERYQSYFGVPNEV